jgi:hypothetical protein
MYPVILVKSRLGKGFESSSGWEEVPSLPFQKVDWGRVIIYLLIYLYRFGIWTDTCKTVVSNQEGFQDSSALIFSNARLETAFWLFVCNK